MKLHKLCTILLIFMTAAQILPAQEQNSFSEDVLFADSMAMIGWSSIGLQFGLYYLLGIDGEMSANDHILASAALELGNIPLYLTDDESAALYSAGSAGLWLSEAVVVREFGTQGDFASSLYWSRIDHTMYKAYRGYALARLQSDKYDNRDFTLYGMEELYFAPFNPNVMKDPVLLGTIAAETVLSFALHSIFDPPDYSKAVWNTGEAYIGQEQVGIEYFLFYNGLFSIYDAVTTAVGEEAIFRGVLYEELKYHFGLWPARIIDSLAFTSMHLITDLIRGHEPSYIILHNLLILTTNIAYDYLYDRGGLQYTVAQHAWYDIFAFFNYKVSSYGVAY
jgi:membrane protease YdiL (CAAX protease family)